MKINIDLGDELISKFELSFSELIVLEVFKKNKDPNLKNICKSLDKFNLKEDSIYRILKRLERKGLISYKNTLGKNLYLIADDEKTIMKIGVSNNTENRLCSLQTSFYKKLNIVFDIKCKGHLEKELHSIFKKFRLSGEWFSYSNEILEKFKQLSNG